MRPLMPQSFQNQVDVADRATGDKHVYHVYAVLTNRRRELIESLNVTERSDGHSLSISHTPSARSCRSGL